MVEVKIKDLDNLTFLEGFENDHGKFFMSIGRDDEHELYSRFTTLDVDDAKFLIKELTKFVKKNKDLI